MTVPTPSSPDPDNASMGAPDPWAASPAGEEGPGPRIRRELRDVLFCAAAVTLAGVVPGLLWAWLAPRVPLVSDGRAVFLQHPEGEEAVGADGTFVLLTLGAGVVCGLVVFLVRRRGGVGIAAGLALGGLCGAVLAWQTGILLGPDTDVVATAKAVGAGSTFDGPLELKAKGALLAWPLVSTIVHMLLTALFVSDERDGLPAANPWVEHP